MVVEFDAVPSDSFASCAAVTTRRLCATFPVIGVDLQHANDSTLGSLVNFVPS